MEPEALLNGIVVHNRRLLSISCWQLAVRAGFRLIAQLIMALGATHQSHPEAQ
jgi:hypothetical protein